MVICFFARVIFFNGQPCLTEQYEQSHADNKMKIHTLLPAFSCEHLQKLLLLLLKYTPSNPERNFTFTSCIHLEHYKLQ